jgi:hypothetical protein
VARALGDQRQHDQAKLAVIEYALGAAAEAMAAHMFMAVMVAAMMSVPEVAVVK